MREFEFTLADGNIATLTYDRQGKKIIDCNGYVYQFHLFHDDKYKQIIDNRRIYLDEWMLGYELIYHKLQDDLTELLL